MLALAAVQDIGTVAQHRDRPAARLHDPDELERDGRRGRRPGWRRVGIGRGHDRRARPPGAAAAAPSAAPGTGCGCSRGPGAPSPATPGARRGPAAAVRCGPWPSRRFLAPRLRKSRPARRASRAPGTHDGHEQGNQPGQEHDLAREALTAMGCPVVGGQVTATASARRRRSRPCSMLTSSITTKYGAVSRRWMNCRTFA